MPIDLHYVDELIQAREDLHGGGVGAPPVLAGGHRAGASINRSCLVMLSALLQTHVEDVFQEAARRSFPALVADPASFEVYWKQVKGWGNPSDANIKNLFLRLGEPDVLSGLSWQRAPSAYIKKRLDVLNQLRNGIAHGRRQLTVDGAPYSLHFSDVRRFRQMVSVFGDRFPAHVINTIN